MFCNIVYSITLKLKKMTISEIKKTNNLRALPSAIGMDISDIASNLMFAIEILSNKDDRTGGDQIILNLLISSAKKLPIFIPDLQKYF